MKPTKRKGSAPFEVMVIVDNPPEFPSWPSAQRHERYQRLVEWHEEYIPRLNSIGSVTHAWGSHQLLTRFDPNTTMGPLVTVYRVSSWDEFDALLWDDPLRDVSSYITSPLGTLVEDKRTDYERTANALARLQRGKTTRQLALLEDYRSKFDGPPEYFGKYKLRNPENARTDINKRGIANSGMDILVIGMNPESLIETYSDARAYILYEKVNWWFDYMAMMIEQGYVTHAWGTHDFCNAARPSTNSKGAVGIYHVRDMEEFHMVYNLDPLREWARFHTIALRPLADQKIADRLRLDLSSKRLSR